MGIGGGSRRQRSAIGVLARPVALVRVLPVVAVVVVVVAGPEVGQPVRQPAPHSAQQAVPAAAAAVGCVCTAAGAAVVMVVVDVAGGTRRPFQPAAVTAGAAATAAWVAVGAARPLGGVGDKGIGVAVVVPVVQMVVVVLMPLVQVVVVVVPLLLLLLCGFLLDAHHPVEDGALVEVGHGCRTRGGSWGGVRMACFIEIRNQPMDPQRGVLRGWGVATHALRPALLCSWVLHLPCSPATHPPTGVPGPCEEGAGDLKHVILHTALLGQSPRVRLQHTRVGNSSSSSGCG